MKTVVVVDDQELLRAGLVGIIRTAPDLKVVGQAADGAEGVDVVQRTRPDVVLMDIRMPVLDGIEATGRITGSTDTRVLILTVFDEDEYVHGALVNGASGFVLKDTPPGELLHAIRVIAAGDALLSPKVTRRLIDRFAGSRCEVELPDTVTRREREVLALVAAGHTNHEIAQELHIGLGTAKTHVARLLMKLDARDRVQLVIRTHGLDSR